MANPQSPTIRDSLGLRIWESDAVLAVRDYFRQVVPHWRWVVVVGLPPFVLSILQATTGISLGLPWWGWLNLVGLAILMGQYRAWKQLHGEVLPYATLELTEPVRAFGDKWVLRLKVITSGPIGTYQVVVRRLMHFLPGPEPKWQLVWRNGKTEFEMFPDTPDLVNLAVGYPRGHSSGRRDLSEGLFFALEGEAPWAEHWAPWLDLHHPFVLARIGVWNNDFRGWVTHATVRISVVDNGEVLTPRVAFEDGPTPVTLRRLRPQARVSRCPA